MTVSSVSSGAPTTPPPAQDSSVKTAMQQLTSAIGAGDVKAAQTAYATLTSLQQTSGQSNSGPFAQALSSIGDALGKGDIATAQSVLGSAKAAHGKHHHHHGAPPAAAPASDNDNAASATGTTSTSTPNNLVDVTA